MPKTALLSSGRLLPRLPGEIVARADDVEAVQLRIGQRVLQAAVRAPGLLTLEGEACDQPGERIGIREQLLEALGASQRPGEPPDRLTGLGGRGLEPPGRWRWRALVIFRSGERSRPNPRPRGGPPPPHR